MGLFDADGLTHGGYGGKPCLTGRDIIESGLSGIGQTSEGGYLGRTAIEAVEKYYAAGHSDAETMSFARGIAAKHGRFF